MKKILILSALLSLTLTLWGQDNNGHQKGHGQRKSHKGSRGQHQGGHQGDHDQPKGDHGNGQQRGGGHGGNHGQQDGDKEKKSGKKESSAHAPATPAPTTVLKPVQPTTSNLHLLIQ